MTICPACNGNSNKYLDSFGVNQDGTQNILPSTYRIFACNTCGLYFKNYIPEDHELNTFYNSLGDSEWNYQLVYPHEKYLKHILAGLPDKANVLDVGCNTGRLLKDETGRLNCYGVEINKEAAKVAESAGIKIIAEKVENGNIGTGQFDLITLIDVFEHLNDPLPFIAQLTKALKPKGKLFIFTGRTDCLPAQLCGSYYWYFKPAQHLIFLNEKFIKWFEERNKDLKVSMVPMRHFYSNFQTSVYQISWLIAWRFFSPHSPYKLIGIKSLSRMKEPFMVTCWKDHVFFIIENNIS
jgi:2-polyprenyl-3-methyl-5-hydroxy-6-metoxy-1,4-benzoquinol methylase